MQLVSKSPIFPLFFRRCWRLRARLGQPFRRTPRTSATGSTAGGTLRPPRLEMMPHTLGCVTLGRQCSDYFQVAARCDAIDAAADKIREEVKAQRHRESKYFKVSEWERFRDYHLPLEMKSWNHCAFFQSTTKTIMILNPIQIIWVGIDFLKGDFDW